MNLLNVAARLEAEPVALLTSQPPTATDPLPLVLVVVVELVGGLGLQEVLVELDVQLVLLEIELVLL